MVIVQRFAHEGIYQVQTVLYLTKTFVVETKRSILAHNIAHDVLPAVLAQLGTKVLNPRRQKLYIIESFSIPIICYLEVI